MNVSIIRQSEVLQLRGRRRSSNYEDERNGLITPRVKIGPRAVGWPAHEIHAINSARVAGKSDDEIRALVRALVEARRAAA